MILDLETKKAIKVWIADLESGRYSQTQGCLQDRSGFCCLGVACLRYSYQVGEGSILVGGMPFQKYGAPEWLANVDGDFKYLTGKNLSDLNDTFHWDFASIAEALRIVYLEDQSLDLREMNQEDDDQD